jgi:hypothetical protein
MEQEEIISYLQIVHQLWIDKVLDEDDVCSYLDELNHDFSIVDPEKGSIKFLFKDNWYPTLISINNKGKVIISTNPEDL